MPKLIPSTILDDAVLKATQLDLCFQAGLAQSRHVPFTFTPSEISASALSQLDSVSPLLGRLTQTLASCNDLINAATL